MNEAEPDLSELTQKSGEQLAAARKKLGLNLQDIADRTRVPLRHLQAIESSNHEALPGTTYSAGFVRAYARMVGLDADALTFAFRSEYSERNAPLVDHTPLEPADPSRTPPRLLAGIGLLTALLFALGWALWRGGGDHDTIQQLAVVGDTPAVSTRAAPPPAAKPRPAPPSNTDTVVLSAGAEDVWVKVYEKNGAVLFMGTLSPGDRYEIPAGAIDPQLMTGRPQSLAITIGQRKFDAIEPRMRTIRDFSLKPVWLVEYLTNRPLPDARPLRAAPPPMPRSADVNAPQE